MTKGDIFAAWTIIFLMISLVILSANHADVNNSQSEINKTVQNQIVSIQKELKKKVMPSINVKGRTSVYAANGEIVVQGNP